MMSFALHAWSSWIAERLLAGSLQGAAAVTVVWLLCRRFRAIPASVRAQAWWIVSLGMLLSLSALPSLRMPVLPAPAPPAPVTAITDVRDHQGGPSNVRLTRNSPQWLDIVIALWVAGVVVQMYRLSSSYASLRRAVRRSTPLPEDDRADSDRAAAAIGLKHTPSIRVSDDIGAPLVAGIVRPIVLIPACAIDGLSSRERAMVIGHELAHIRRRDLLFAWVPAVAERLFFFHPLVRLAAREYAAERESACDAIVLNVMDAAPQEYGHMLLRLGVGRLNPVFTVGGSSPSVGALKRRLDMLHEASSIHSFRATALVVLVALLAVLPLRVVAKAAAVHQDAAPSPSATAQPPAKPDPPTNPQPAVPPASREAARSLELERAKVEQAVVEHESNVLQVEAEFLKLQATVDWLKAAIERQQANVQNQLTDRQTESVATTKQFLENRLRELTVEQELMNQRKGQIDLMIDAVRKELERVR
jgi:beta-lactamase regulating signal transducer with metallopeptidase domain